MIAHNSINGLVLVFATMVTLTLGAGEEKIDYTSREWDIEIMKNDMRAQYRKTAINDALFTNDAAYDKNHHDPLTDIMREVINPMAGRPNRTIPELVQDALKKACKTCETGDNVVPEEGVKIASEILTMGYWLTIQRNVRDSNPQIGIYTLTKATVRMQRTRAMSNFNLHKLGSTMKLYFEPFFKKEYLRRKNDFTKFKKLVLTIKTYSGESPLLGIKNTMQFDWTVIYDGEVDQNPKLSDFETVEETTAFLQQLLVDLDNKKSSEAEEPTVQPIEAPTEQPSGCASFIGKLSSKIKSLCRKNE